jgi:hypothetical protein
MLDAHRIRPEPRFFVDVIAEDRSIVANRGFDDGCVFRAGDRNGRVRPHLFAFLAAANEVRKQQSNSKDADHEIEEYLKALVASEVEARNGDVPEDTQHGTSPKNKKPRKICGA